MLGLLSHVPSRVIVGMQLRALGSLFALLLVTACTDSVIDAPPAPTGTVAEAIIGAQRSASAYAESVTVKVNNAASDFCTGTIVAPRVVLTAAHCVVFNGGGTWVAAAPFATGAPSRTISQAYADPNFPRTNYDNQDIYPDIGFLFPDAGAGFNGIAFPTLSRTAAAVGKSVSAVGRKTSSATAPLVLSSATPLLTADTGYANDYRTTRLTDGGDSGGGLFLDGTHMLLGAERVFDEAAVMDYWVEYAGTTYDTILAKIAANGGFVNLAPTAPKVATLGTQTFAVTAGAGGAYTYSLSTNNSHGSIDATTGTYTAGATGSVTDVVTGTDSAGRTGSVNVTVGAAVSINPATQTVAPRGKVTFSAKDGSDGGYVFSLGKNLSGATLSGANYTAGTTGSVSDTVHVVDSSGGAADATISVSAGVTIEPANPSTPAKGKITLTATGGSGTGYTWKLTTGPSGGSVDATGHYTAGATSLVTDDVTVTDSLGNAQIVEIPVGFPLTIRDSGTLPPRGAVELVAIGGSGTGYIWTITENNSGATLDPNGNYVAGTKGDVRDVITLADSTGTAVTGQEEIGPVLAIAPGDSTVTAGGMLTFAAVGGAGTGYTFTLDAAPSGGMIDGALYTAGMTGDVSDLVTAHDPLGNTAMAHIMVLPHPAVDAGAAAAPAPSSSGCNTAGHGSANGSLAVALGALLVLRARRRRRG